MANPASIMVQGTGSDVGKSLIVAGLARAYARSGLRVKPFKAQNMSNNAGVTAEGGEIGRAQMLQARAAGVAPTVDMNPVLLKPMADHRAEIVVQGQHWGFSDATNFGAHHKDLLAAALASFQRLQAKADLILIEGAGSPAEVNLRARDIANMGFSSAAGVPVILLGDVDRGGVIASLVGTHQLLPPEDRALVKGFAINKFRGSLDLFQPAVDIIEQETGWRGFGTIPWFDEAALLPAEDAVVLERPNTGEAGGVKIACLMLPRIANFDDLDPLRAEPDVDVQMIPPGQALPGDYDLVIIPGSRASRADLQFVRDQGWDIDLKAHHRRGGKILGLCGGYQILGRQIADPDGLDGPAGVSDGLGLLDIETVLQPEKQRRQVEGQHMGSGLPVTGYEIHLGVTSGPDCNRPLFEIEGQPDGAISPDCQVMGAYLHGLFAADDFRSAFLADLGHSGASTAYEDRLDQVLDRLAAHLETHLDLNGILKIAKNGLN